MIPANPNKLLSICTVRHAAALVVRQFDLQQEDVWELCYCSTQHSICAFQFIAKCVSLVNQWEDKWVGTLWGRQWIAAIRERKKRGRLSSLFMNMMPSRYNNRATNLLKCVMSSHTDNRLHYMTNFCAQQIELLRQFADDLLDLEDGASTVEFLQRALNKNGPLHNLKHIGVFLAAQLPFILYIWNLLKIPCWRASECPILDPEKQHYRRGTQNAARRGRGRGGGAAAPPEYTTLHSLATDRDQGDIKSLEVVHQALCIVAHMWDTSELYVENSCCEGVHPNDVVDCLLLGMVSFDLQPALWISPYQPTYQLWKKAWGDTEEWTLVPPERESKVLSLLTRD